MILFLRWPVLTVETEATGDSWSTNKRDHSLVGTWACRFGTRAFCPTLAAQVVLA
jgi:hypothetical protein